MWWIRCRIRYRCWWNTWSNWTLLCWWNIWCLFKILKFVIRFQNQKSYHKSQNIDLQFLCKHTIEGGCVGDILGAIEDAIEGGTTKSLQNWKKKNSIANLWKMEVIADIQWMSLRKDGLMTLLSTVQCLGITFHTSIERWLLFTRDERHFTKKFWN